MSDIKKFSIFNFQFSLSERGVSLYFAIAVMTILLAIGLGLSTIIIIQTKMIREMGDSVIALHAADTGIERALYGLYKETPQQDYAGTLITYRAWITQPPGQPEEEKIPDIPEDSNCQAEYYCLKSIGTFRGIKRAIEASY